MKNKKVLMTMLSLLLVVFVQFSAGAHSGRTDSSGGHRDNRNASGLGYYHYHCGGYPAHLHKNGKCPYDEVVYAEGIRVYDEQKQIAGESLALLGAYEINCGEEVNLKAEVYPEDAEDYIVEWESNNPEIVEISRRWGELTAVGVGEAIVTVSTERGTKETFKVKVKEIYPDKIVIENKTGEILEDEIKIRKGEQIELEAVITPYNTTNKKVYWNVSDSEIAKIDKEGKLTAISPGTVTVTARAINGVKANIDVEVYSSAGAVVGGVGTAVAAGAGYYFIRRRKKRENE